jgi:hypothetical protein
MLVLGYVGFVPPNDQSILMGKIATVIYFAQFALLPFLSKMEEKWLIKRGLPPEVEALIAGEAREKSKLPQRRRSGDVK